MTVSSHCEISESLKSRLAPVALFVFKRPEHTRKTLEALARNPEFSDSPLHVFCDGPRRISDDASVNQTRDIVRQWVHPDKTIVESIDNVGLANSIISGVSKLCDLYGRVIVVEDDLIVSAVFIKYMNHCLERYAENPMVMQVSGYMFPVETGVDADAVFLPMTTSWGWATWRRAWPTDLRLYRRAAEYLSDARRRFAFDLSGAYPYSRMLADSAAGKKHSWAVWWQFHVFSQGGLGIFPTKSLVDNNGMDGSGTNSIVEKNSVLALPSSIGFSHPMVAINTQALARIRVFLIKNRGLLRFIKDNYYRIVGMKITLPPSSS